MYIEKNYLDNLFDTVMDVKVKTKAIPKERMDLKEYCRRKELWLHELPNNKICEWVKNLRMLEGYALNFRKRADMNEGKLISMRSHYCNVLMGTLIPITFSHLQKRIWKPITEVSLF